MRLKWFRVATSGATIDGREITPAQIDQMAVSYNPTTYGARVWVEHLRSFMPDSPFRAYGDVLAVRAEDAGDGKRALLAQIDATEDLLKLNAGRQKVYWSIEMDPAFAGTGQAYMVGLAITDSPASLGTEMLKFAVSNPQAPGAVKAHLFGSHVEGSALEADPLTEDKPTLLTKVKELLSGQSRADTARFGAIETAVQTIATDVGELRTAIAAFTGGAKPEAKADPTLSAAVEKLSADLAALTAKVTGTSPNPVRPPTTGGGSFTATDC